MNPIWLEDLLALGPCVEAVQYARKHPTLSSAWAECTRGDWMLWLIAETIREDIKDRKRLVLAACECARTALKYVPEAEKRPLVAIETAERWARGEVGVTIEDVKIAVNAAYAAAYAADYASANAAAAAAYAASVAYAATHATYTTNVAYAAAYTTAYAAYAANADTSREDSLAECASIVRRHYPKPPSLRIKKEKVNANL